MPTIEKLIVELRAENRDLKNKLNQSGDSVDSFGSKVGKIGGLIAGAFAVDRIVSFGSELVKLGNTAEGVQIAFNNLAEVSIQGLREATQGTVSDLELMQAAVKAKNFKIPLEKLGTFFEFATNRAKATGESVDYLVESIINGIGRKSTLVLDNLGISASELQKEIKLTGDFGKAAGNIIAREMENTDQAIKDTVDTVGQLNTSFSNLKLTLSKLIGEEGAGLTTTVTNWITAFDRFIDNNYNLSIDAVKQDVKDLTEEIERQNRALKEGSDIDSLFNLSPGEFGKEILDRGIFGQPTDLASPQDVDLKEKERLNLQERIIENFNEQILQFQEQQKLKEEQAALDKIATEEAARQEAIQQQINETGRESLRDLQNKIALEEFFNQELEREIELQQELADIAKKAEEDPSRAFTPIEGKGLPSFVEGVDPIKIFGEATEDTEDLNAGLDDTLAKMKDLAIVTSLFGSILGGSLTTATDNIGDLIGMIGTLIVRLATATSIATLFEAITGGPEVLAKIAIAGAAIGVVGGIISTLTNDSKIRSGDIATSNRFATSGAGSRTSTSG